MIIAVTSENGEVFQHFGHTPEFTIYETKGDELLGPRVIPTGENGHGALAGILDALGVEVLICGGIGGGAQMALASAGIQLCGGVSGSCDAAVEAYLANNLGYNPNVKCDHHDHEHDNGAHSLATTVAARTIAITTIVPSKKVKEYSKSNLLQHSAYFLWSLQP